MFILTITTPTQAKSDTLFVSFLNKLFGVDKEASTLTQAKNKNGVHPGTLTLDKFDLISDDELLQLFKQALEEAGVPSKNVSGIKSLPKDIDKDKLAQYILAKTKDGDKKYIICKKDKCEEDFDLENYLERQKKLEELQAELLKTQAMSMQETQEMMRISNLMTFALVIPLSVLRGLADLAARSQSPAARAFAGSLMSTVAGIAQKVALQLAKMGKIDFAKQLVYVVSLIGALYCTNKEKCDSNAFHVDEHGEPVVSTNQQGVLVTGESPKYEIIDAETGEKVQEFGIAANELDEDCIEVCSSVDIFNQGLNEAADIADEAYGQSKVMTDEFMENQSKFTSAEQELQSVKAQKAKAREQKDTQKVAQLEKRETELNTTLFYNA